MNRGQSTNDVIPTAGKLTVLFLLQDLYKSLQALKEAFARKGVEFDSVLKMGRTQLQDAVPIRLGQEFKAYATALERGLRRIRSAAEEMTSINMGGTAIGTGVNASASYSRHIAEDLSRLTGFSFTQAADLIDATQNIDSFAAVSGSLKDCAIALSKISNDLRLMSSGPRTGLEEINLLAARQNGSSIMPGKVNPVIPEVVSQVAFRIVGNDTCIAMAVEAGQLELNAFEPVVFYSLFQSIDTLREAADTLRINCGRHHRQPGALPAPAEDERWHRHGPESLHRLRQGRQAGQRSPWPRTSLWWNWPGSATTCPTNSWNPCWIRTR